MGHVSTNINETIDIHPETDWLDNGWSISGGRAIHDSCNSGYITNRNIVTTPGVNYKITYTVSGRSSGQVYPTLGGVEGVHRTSNGTFTQNITAIDNSGLNFWSDGNLTISNLTISLGTVDPITLAFNEDNLKWVGYYSFAPEMMSKLLDGFYSFRDGAIWEHDVNEVRNSFYGIEYPSKIVFYLNVNHTTVKNLSSMRINGNKPWAITDIYIEPRYGKSNGQRSRIKKGNFRSLQGQWYADFLRDMNDSRFSNELQALMKGALLQGQVAKITMETTDTSEVRLVSVDILESPQQYTY